MYNLMAVKGTNKLLMNICHISVRRTEQCKSLLHFTSI